MNTLQDLRELLATDAIPLAVGDIVHSTHARAQWSAGRGHFEGTVRAALFGVLRERLPRTWLVEAETFYPSHKGSTNDRTDIIVWSPADEPLVIEVKPSDDLQKLRADVGKLSRHIGMKSSKLQHGVIAFLAYRTNLAVFDEARRPTGAIQLLPIPVR